LQETRIYQEAIAAQVIDLVNEVIIIDDDIGDAAP